jgi:hypothetical protein
MANFQSVPRGDRISGQTLIVAPPSVTVGVWGYLASPGNEVLVTSSDPAVRVARGSIVGNVRLWVVTGAAGQQARLEAAPAGGGVWDSIEVHFRAGHHASGGVDVRPILAQLTGSAGTNNLIPATLPLHFLMRESTFRPGDPSNTPSFVSAGGWRARVGVFAARQGSLERAAILLLPETGTPDRVLVGITHVFAQSKDNRAYYGGLGWSDPLSPRLIADVTTRFVHRRWGPQVLASKKNMAFLLPVRAQGDELGPFRDGAFLREVLESASAATSRAFTYDHVEMFTFSSGIYDLNAMLPSVRSSLNLEAIYNLDPAGGTPAHSTALTRQFLSGQTTHGQARAGFELMSLPRWANENDFASVNPNDSNQVFNYLHNGVLPSYCLYLGIQRS